MDRFFSPYLTIFLLWSSRISEVCYTPGLFMP
jgi:hypothetical protein